jgi:hypothetical protein
MKVFWKWLLLTVTALGSFAFLLMFPHGWGPPAVETAAPTARVETLVPTSEPVAPTTAPSLAPTFTPAPTRTAVPTQTPTFVAQVRLQPGTPVYLPFFRLPEVGCNWLGVAGQIFDREGQPLAGIVVVVQGQLGETRVDAVSVSGAAPAYGPGGYELQLADAPIASTASLAVTLYDLDGAPLIEPLPFDTHSACTQNLVLINFQQN